MLAVLDSANVSGFRKFMRMSYTTWDSALNLQNPFTICGFFFYNLRIPPTVVASSKNRWLF